jgi:uncharacterized membrane protein YkoI
MRSVTTWSVLSVLAAFVVSALLGCTQHKKEEGTKVAAGNVPPKVMDAMKARFPGAEVTSVEKENEGGNVIYDLELKQGGRKYEMDVKEDGTVVEVETAIEARDLPEAATRAVQAKYPNATMKEVMSKTKGAETKPHEYEVVLATGDGKTREVTVSPDGTITEDAAGEKQKENK